ncbi:thermonuclease family protein [Actinomarinicola tropica]|uniref:Thermonuclease n=1 Tax=Actinomarinicola tropica TaxID=2789776 RepID=A0A5Q2RGL5_9ACTN|nr:thermonuclease family protein [Actinomarinicola tropica]QGG94774.1 thermonuclease [Actinomarinicola tropica]
MTSRLPLRAAILVVAVFVAVALLVLRPDGDAADPVPAGHGRVVDVVDGDTLRLDIGGEEETVRLLGIDTPEVRHPTRPVECYGAEASDRLAALTPPGAVLRLERDEEARDHYGRLLLYVHATAADGSEIFVNRQMVLEGAAVALAIDPNDAHRDVLADAERQARDAERGLWGACGGPGVPVDPLSDR